LAISEELEAAADSSAAEACPLDRFAGRGIVICAGGARFFTCAWVAIGILRRHLGCTLPIEVWYLGPEEMGPSMRALLESEGARAIDAFEVAKRYPASRFDGWELKTYAILNSRFREVLLLDADNVPVADPAFLFDCPEFVETGALFWPDIVRIAAKNAIWALSGLEFRDGPAFESGQLLVDKTRCWGALRLAHWMNQRAEAFYEILYGDKDTFLIAWLLRNAAFSLIPHAPWQLEGCFCQRGPNGTALFQHRNAAKWILEGCNPPIEGFLYETDCLALLTELAKRWDGTIFNPPPRDAECRAIEASLIQQRGFRLIRIGEDETGLELRADHSAVRTGAFAFYWHVERAEADPQLVLHARGLRCCALILAPDGVWRGAWLRPPYMPVALAGREPAAPALPAPDPTGSAAWFDALLALYERLPWDAETSRDFVGAVRSLARVDSQAGACLPTAASRAELSPVRAALLDAALDAIGRRGERAETIPRRAFSTWDYEQL
jgi:Mannosyltransferase putative